MHRPYRTIKANALLELAEREDVTIAVLEEIVVELEERKNSHALYVLVKVGAILEAVRKRSREKLVQRRRTEKGMIEQEGYFEWPSTDAPASKYGFSGDVFFYDEGILSYVGYQVGYDGLGAIYRQKILDCIFHNVLPNVVSEDYMKEWGSPKSAYRLQKLAESIAAFTRNAKRNYNADYSRAIDHWQTDLDYLYHKYYVGQFHFHWPMDF